MRFRNNLTALMTKKFFNKNFSTEVLNLAESKGIKGSAFTITIAYMLTPYLEEILLKRNLDKLDDSYRRLGYGNHTNDEKIQSCLELKIALFNFLGLEDDPCINHYLSMIFDVGEIKEEAIKNIDNIIRSYNMDITNIFFTFLKILNPSVDCSDFDDFEDVENLFGHIADLFFDYFKSDYNTIEKKEVLFTEEVINKKAIDDIIEALTPLNLTRRNYYNTFLFMLHPLLEKMILETFNLLETQKSPQRDKFYLDLLRLRKYLNIVLGRNEVSDANT